MDWVSRRYKAAHESLGFEAYSLDNKLKFECSYTMPQENQFDFINFNELLFIDAKDEKEQSNPSDDDYDEDYDEQEEEEDEEEEEEEEEEKPEEEDEDEDF